MRLPDAATVASSALALLTLRCKLWAWGVAAGVLAGRD